MMENQPQNLDDLDDEALAEAIKALVARRMSKYEVTDAYVFRNQVLDAVESL